MESSLERSFREWIKNRVAVSLPASAQSTTVRLDSIPGSDLLVPLGRSSSIGDASTGQASTMLAGSTDPTDQPRIFQTILAPCKL